MNYTQPMTARSRMLTSKTIGNPLDNRGAIALPIGHGPYRPAYSSILINLILKQSKLSDRLITASHLVRY